MRAHYDYVIVGAGSAGCVVASRLAEDPHVRVLLVEAGGDGQRDLVRAPALYPLLFRSARDHALVTEPQAGLGGRRVYVPRGRGLGGSSAINASIWHRGHVSDYDAWAAMGATGWDHASLAPHFAASRVRTTRAPASTALDMAFVEAAARVSGLPIEGAYDLDGDGYVGRLALSTHRGARVSLSDAYLAEPRPNLDVRLDSVVAHVTLEGTRATGVVLVRGGQPEHVHAAREVILAAGAIASPALLMRSGIGPEDALREGDIAVRHVLPGVGENLHDHMYAYLTHRARRGGDRFPIGEAARAVPTDLEGTPYASNHVGVGAFVTTTGEVPDLQLYFTTWPAPEPNLDTKGARYDDGPCFTIMPCPLQPKSRGRVRLASDSPFDAPRIDPAYLTADDDVEAFVRGFAIAREVIADRASDAFRGEALVPGATREAVIADVRRRAGSVHHAVGTCRIGEDDQAVVTPTLEVRGLSGLRVVDASVMPRITSGNTNAPVVAVAERAAALIRQASSSSSSAAGPTGAALR